MKSKRAMKAMKAKDHVAVDDDGDDDESMLSKAQIEQAMDKKEKPSPKDYLDFKKEVVSAPVEIQKDFNLARA